MGVRRHQAASSIRSKSKGRQAGRPAIQPVSQILDRLHVARFAARNMHSCDLAQFFHVVARCGKLHA
jgi:hypothetical protein